MRIRTKPGYSYDDVLLVPQHSRIASRQDVDLSTKLGSLELKVPFLSANMDTVTEGEMAAAMGNYGGAGILHRFAGSDLQYLWAQQAFAASAPIILSVGLEHSLWRFYQEINDEFGLNGLCVDVAHGDHARVIETVQFLRKNFPKQNIIAGNVATGRAALRLVEAGANIIKVGIGPGSVCSTRVVSGHGFPQLSAIEEVDQTLQIEGCRLDDRRVAIIADGGIRYPGDIVKALAAGADAVMLGSLFAGTDEAAGQRVIEDGIAYKTFRGMASREAQQDKRAGRTPRVEGVSARVPYRGPVHDTLANLEAGIRSGLSYSGSLTLAELRDAAEFVVVTGNTLKESHPHHPYRL